jgi:GNAT superfamily N-acetyltransferase
MNNQSMIIRDARPNDGQLLARIIRASFHDVAVRFALTAENCPKHPSNCTTAWIETDRSRGVAYFILFYADRPVGCVGLEQPGPDLCFLERLAVLPDMRRRGFGRALVRHALERAAEKGARRVSVGIIAGQMELKHWYAACGFVDVHTKQFPHLPFQVRLMELDLMKPTDFLYDVRTCSR